MIEKRATNAAEFPVDKPWGYDIHPDLWYIMSVTLDGMGLLSADGVDADGNNVTFALCFGNSETASVYAFSVPEIDTNSTKPVQGHIVLEMFKALHALVTATASPLQ